MLVHLMCMFMFLYSYISGSLTLNLKLFFHHKNVIRPSNSINEMKKRNLLMVSMQLQNYCKFVNNVVKNKVEIKLKKKRLYWCNGNLNPFTYVYQISVEPLSQAFCLITDHNINTRRLTKFFYIKGRFLVQIKIFWAIQSY